MPVNNFVFRQADVDHSPPHLGNNRSQINSELDRPLSVYDNINPQKNNSNTYLISEIKFRFNESRITSGTMRDSSDPNTVHCSKQTTTLPVHKYENVHVALQMRNKRESDQEVKINQSNEQSTQQRSVMSPAKSSFFGLNDQETSRLNSNYEIENNTNLYMNIMTTQLPVELKVQSNQEKISATSSISGSSSTTVTPSDGSPVRERTENSHKNRVVCDRSKSPKFMLPESSGLSPSQVDRSSLSIMFRRVSHQLAINYVNISTRTAQSKN